MSYISEDEMSIQCMEYKKSKSIPAKEVDVDRMGNSEFDMDVISPSTVQKMCISNPYKREPSKVRRPVMKFTTSNGEDFVSGTKLFYNAGDFEDDTYSEEFSDIDIDSEEPFDEFETSIGEFDRFFEGAALPNTKIDSTGLFIRGDSASPRMFRTWESTDIEDWSNTVDLFFE